MSKLSITDVKQIFLECEYPFYKNLKIDDNQLTCIFYSVYSDYKKPIQLMIHNKEQVMHGIALEIIKFQSEEMLK